MSSTKFQPLRSTDDYHLNDMAQNPRRINDPERQANLNAQTPARWKSIKAAYTPQVTYVAAPNDDDHREKETRPSKNNRRSTSRLTLMLNPVTNFSIPRFAAPWQHDKPEGSSATTTVRSFHRAQQWRRLFINGFLQWLFTLAIVLGEWALLFGFSRETTLGKWQKYTFNAMITLLSLSLGLAIVAALQSYAKLLSWRFLASKYRDLQDFELIMNCNSQSKVLKLLWASRTQGKFWLNTTQVLCLLSLTVVVGMQLTIGLLGLTYSVDNSLDARYEEGIVSIADLSNIYQDPTHNATSYADQTGAANYYGLVGQNYNWDYKPLGQGNDGYEYVYTSDNQSYFYNFVDQNAEAQPGQQASIKTSKRWIQSTATCVPLKILGGGYLDSDSTYQMLNYTDERGRFRSIYVDGPTTFTSTYMSNSSNATTCGPRCTSMLILDSAGFSDAEDAGTPFLFACNNTLSEVYNSNECTLESNCTLNDDLARILAGGIGWSGSYYGVENPLQYKTYPPGSPYSWDGYIGDYQNATFRAAQIAYFTAGAIAAMDDSGPHITVPGMAPQPGVTLNVNWKYAIPVLCIVPSVQLIVLIIVCIWANGAMIRDGSYLSSARLLRPVVEKLEEHGCALTGDEIARSLGNFKIIYGVRAPAGSSSSTSYSSTDATDTDWHVGIIAESEGFGHVAEEGWKPAAMFPGGQYDGAGYPMPQHRLSPKKAQVLAGIEEESSDDESFTAEEGASLLGKAHRS